MEKKSNGIVKGFLIVAGVIASLAGAIAVLYTMTVMLTIWKFLKRNIVDLIS